MAKLKAPLFSLGARGKLGDALVFFPWKGVHAVRTYVIPANPQTAAQQAQRAHMTAAVLEWHGASYTALDVTAWNRYAGIIAGSLSGFNSMIRAFIIEKILGNTWQRCDDLTIAGVGSTAFDVDLHLLAPGADPTCHYGTRKTHMPDTQVLDNVGSAHWAKTISSLSADTLYYLYVSHGSSGSDYGRTGIYQQRTTA